MNFRILGFADGDVRQPDASEDLGLGGPHARLGRGVGVIVAQEVQHAVDAQKAGAVALPEPVRQCMRMAAKVMTTVAYRV